MDQFLFCRRSVLRVALLVAGASLFRSLPGAAESVEGEHQPTLDLRVLAEDPTAVPVRVSVDHPMELDHFITSIEVTLDADPVSRKGVFLFTPANGRAWVAFQMRSGVGGLVKAMAECSRHGRFVGTREIRVAADGCTSLPGKVAKDRIGNPRLRVPGSFRMGEVIEVRTKIDHPSDTGLAFTDGKFVLERPEFFVKQMRVSFDGQLISDFRLTSAVSPNPLIRLPLKMTGAGTLQVMFANNEGQQWETTQFIQPAGVSLPSFAAQGDPKKGGGAFEHVHALAMDAAGKILFLGAHTGLFRSEDGGRSWQKVALSPKHSHLDVMAIAPHPRDPLILSVGTHEAGVFKSTDGGATWREANSGLGGIDVHGLAIDPNAPQKLHAAVREKGEGIYRTTNGGGKWTRVDDGPGGEVKVLASVNIPTGMGGIYLYAGTAAGLQRNPDCF